MRSTRGLVNGDMVVQLHGLAGFVAQSARENAQTLTPPYCRAMGTTGGMLPVTSAAGGIAYVSGGAGVVAPD